MDYVTNPISRQGLRGIARVFREIFSLSSQECVPVVDLLDVFCQRLGNVTYDIVENWELPSNVPATTELGTDGIFTIKIKEIVYNGAKYRNVGGYRNHIMHEMCHVLLMKIGFRPLLARSFSNYEIKPMCSAEWQAKALCGEIMMPYEATRNMSVSEIVDTYKVSVQSAQQRKKY